MSRMRSSIRRGLSAALVLGLFCKPATATDPLVADFFAIPRPAGASLVLHIQMRQDDPYPATLDYLREGTALYVRLNIAGGGMAGQQVLMRLPEDKRRYAYFAFHPLLGGDALSRQQLNRQFAVAGFHVDDLLNALDPARAGRPDDWASRTAPGVRVVLAPANTHGCRDEYEFHGATQDLPQTIRLCRETKTHQQVLELDGSFVYAGYRLPKRLVLKQGTHPIGEILIGAADLQRWRDMAHYENTSLGGTD